MFEGKTIRFSPEKNAALKKERNVSFDEVIFCLEQDMILDIIYNPSPRRRKQKLLIVEINGYAHVVPYVETPTEVFLKTVYPSRRMTKLYLKDIL